MDFVGTPEKVRSNSAGPVSGIWLVMWALALSVVWLLPNHYPPWSSFHMESSAAVMFALIAAAIIFRSPACDIIHGPGLLVAFMLPVPFIQYFAGMVGLIGSAWVSTSYILGFLLALMVGACWEKQSPGQMVDGLLLAVGIAGIFSVGLQLHQWLLLERLDIWSMGNGLGRPFANFGQPNQLGTFLIWCLLAVAWGLERGYVRAGVAFALSIYLLFGIALTQSRTAWIAILILIGASWFWRRLWRYRSTPWVVTLLGLYFVACNLCLSWFSQLLLLEDVAFNGSELARLSAGLRPIAWMTFLDAGLRRPWFGYGWDQIAHGQLAASLDHPALNMLFSHSHNLFLDLVLWCGIPFGLFLSLAIIWWFWRSFRAVKSAENVLMLLLLVVVMNHAMLEFPLHYAYFLLPFGLIMGALDTRLAVPQLRLSGRWIVMTVWVSATVLLSLVVRDYYRAEASMQVLRFEWAGINVPGPKGPPDVLLLTQLRDIITYARFEPGRGMSPESLQWMRTVVSLYPSAGSIHKLAAALAWNQQPEEAQVWLRRMCRVGPVLECEAVRRAWTRQALTDPQIRAVPWPEKRSTENNSGG